MTNDDADLGLIRDFYRQIITLQRRVAELESENAALRGPSSPTSRRSAVAMPAHDDSRTHGADHPHGRHA